MHAFLQGPTAYERFRETAAFVCPSPNSLRKQKIAQTVSEGDSVELYERIKMFMSTSEIIGQLICDEMKLKGDIYFSTTSKRGINLLDLGNRTQFRVCAACGAYDFVKARKGNTNCCQKCQAVKRKRKQNEKRRIEHRESRVDPKSHVPLSSLSPDELKIRARKANNSRTNVRKFMDRINKRCLTNRFS